MSWLTLDVLRQIFIVVGAIVVGLGWKDQESVNMIIGVLMSLIGATWQLFSNNKVQTEVKALKTEMKALKMKA